MFRAMRRIKQLLSQEQAETILNRNTAGTLALLGDDGYPYAVPISYVYVNNKILMHSAKMGHKIDAIKQCNKASFSVIDQDTIVPEKYTTFFGSVICFGKIRIIDDVEEIKKTAFLLGDKYRPGFKDATEAEIQGALSRFYMLELTIEHMTGKQSIELVQD